MGLKLKSLEEIEKLQLEVEEEEAWEDKAMFHYEPLSR